MTRPLVLLDRDGVLNEDIAPHGTLRLEDLCVYPQAPEAVARLSQAGFAVAVVTNQSAVGKGLMREDDVHAIHAAIAAQCQQQGGQIDAFYSCFDHPDTPSERRKPGAGMLREALHDFQAEAARTPLVGDALRDLQAAAALGCPRILVRTGKGEKTLPTLTADLQPVQTCGNVLDAAHFIVNQYGKQP